MAIQGNYMSIIDNCCQLSSVLRLLLHGETNDQGVKWSHCQSICSMLCLDESMSIWHSMFTCPGWPFGYKVSSIWQQICCGLSRVMLNVELVEGNDRPVELDKPKYDNHGGKTHGILLQMLSKYFLTRRYVVLDLGSCVMKAMVDFNKKSVLILRKKLRVDSHFLSPFV